LGGGQQKALESDNRVNSPQNPAEENEKTLTILFWRKVVKTFSNKRQKNVHNTN